MRGYYSAQRMSQKSHDQLLTKKIYHSKQNFVDSKPVQFYNFNSIRFSIKFHDSILFSINFCCMFFTALILAQAVQELRESARLLMHPVCMPQLIYVFAATLETSVDQRRNKILKSDLRQFNRVSSCKCHIPLCAHTYTRVHIRSDVKSIYCVTDQLNASLFVADSGYRLVSHKIAVQN